MHNIINDNGKELNANFRIVTIDSQLGLTLESRSGSDRNRNYNEALELILTRLVKLGINRITIKVVSVNLLNHFVNPSDRTIKLNDTSQINLQGKDIKKLRQQIGSAISKLKIDQTKKGGNPTKRIQLVSEYLKETEWKNIALGNLNRIEPNNYTNSFDPLKFEEEVAEYLKTPMKQVPTGNLKPRRKINATHMIYERDSKVKAWVLQNANGKCECCEQKGPFIALNGMPYLEVHHLKTLASGGSDTTQNTVALCPNCHKEFHYGINKEKILDKIYKNKKRLKREK